MNVLVTGGAGFIGSHLVRRLHKDGHQVTVLDNLSAGKREYVPKDVTLINGDIRGPLDVAQAIKGKEIVFHLAACTNVREQDEKKDYQINYLGAKNVFDLAKKVGAKIIFTSSAAVYGNAKVPVAETDRCNPRSQYGKSKLKAEKLLYDGNSYVVRLFNVYGPLGKSVINIFAKNIPQYEPITVYGTGMNTRDYVHVRDVVDALVRGIEHKGVYNVGSGIETQLLSVIDFIQSKTNAKPDKTYERQKDEEIKRSCANIDKIKTVTGWVPKVSLEEGIEHVLGLYK